jgi:hypothetical protein
VRDVEGPAKCTTQTVFKHVHITTCYLPKSDKGNNKDTPTYNDFFQGNFLHARNPFGGIKQVFNLPVSIDVFLGILIWMAV